ncbi:hypothetical protein Pyn_19426 [Prunus yedoensis var. nudiflora]|uniref:Uncharacterized protein n=1 Tax=Prunus yedoensis var. nudiflora TaxID=2094558 RepID=A0A314XYY2_PRUYE|nr:hypothetical protein Pyn_19426 [Prunus yedoensis var. nudiflora]
MKLGCRKRNCDAENETVMQKTAETEMKNRFRSLVVFDNGRANGLVVFDDRWWSSMMVSRMGLELWFKTKY